MDLGFDNVILYIYNLPLNHCDHVNKTCTNLSSYFPPQNVTAMTTVVTARIVKTSAVEYATNVR